MKVIPEADKIKLTAFEKQFWDIKKKHFDTVVSLSLITRAHTWIFFKKGKFYELYEKDAEIGHKELDLKISDRVNMKMAGVPETHMNFWASKLINLGYTVSSDILTIKGTK